jgi:hypothetical protein
MTSPQIAVRGIHAVKVTVRPGEDNTGMVALEWTDSAGARREAIYHGYSAHLLQTDLETVTSHSEDARHAYLLGIIRMFTIGTRG